MHLCSIYTTPDYNGLMNQGATCYLNSVLQVLFMTKEFREAVKGHTADNPEADGIERHLTALFEDLKKYQTYTYNITKKLGINNVFEQRDAAECFEKILTSLTSPEASQIFQGQLTHKNKCSKCGAETETHGPFWSLPLELVDSDKKGYSVVDGIDKYFRALDVSGANQMYCGDCDAKSDATIKCEINHHPEVLTLLLKRFKFDDLYMQYVKLRCSVDVPCTLQIPEDETYELYGFVDHIGDLRGGHYTATIKCQDDLTWYNFNDTMVRSVDNKPFQVDNIMKSSSAYLLFYRKKNVKAADTSQDIREESINGGFQSDTSRSSEQSDVRSRKREKDEEAAEGDLYTVDKPENKKKRIVGDQEGNQEQECVCVDKQRDEEKLVTDVKADEEITAGAGQRGKASERGIFLKIYDLIYRFQNNGVGDSKENMSTNQGISNTSHTRHEQQREEKRDVKEDKEYMTRELKHAQMGDTSMTHQDKGKEQKQRSGQNSGLQLVSVEKKGDVEIKTFIIKKVDRPSVGDFRQNKPNDEQEDKQGEKRDGKGGRQRKRGDDECAQRRGTSESHCSDGVEDKPQEQLEEEISRKDVGVERQIKEEEKDKKHIQNRKESFPRQTGSAGSGDLTENQRVHSLQMRPCDQEKKHVMGGRDHPKQEVQITHISIQMSNITNMTTGTAAETFGGCLSRQLSDDKRKDKRTFDPKEDDLDTLSEGVRSLKLKDSPPPVEEQNETKSAIESNVEKMAKESDSQRQVP